MRLYGVSPRSVWRSSTDARRGQAPRIALQCKRHVDCRFVSRNADGDGCGHRAGVRRILCGRNAQALDGDRRKFCGIEHRRTQHVLQRARVGVVGNLGREIGPLLGARLCIVHHETGGRYAQRECRRVRCVRHTDCTANRAVDHDVVVSEVRQRARAKHQDAQLGLSLVDVVDSAANRQFGTPCRCIGAWRRALPRTRCAAGGQCQHENANAETFEHERPRCLAKLHRVQSALGAGSMPSRNTPTRYSAVAQAFHWIIAALIVTQFMLAYMADDLPLGVHKLALLARHKSFGMTILMLAVLRLLWRLRNPAPALPAGMTSMERLLARATHFAFYVLLFAMPLTGWMMSSAKNYSVSWFGAVHLAESHRQERTSLRTAALDAPYPELPAVRDRGSAHSRGAQTSFLEQGRCAAAHAALKQAGEGQIGEIVMMKRLMAAMPLAFAPAAGGRTPRVPWQATRRTRSKAVWSSSACRPARISKVSFRKFTAAVDFCPRCARRIRASTCRSI